MKLELAMTERDKKLLIFLTLFVIVVCFGYWGIRPSVLKMGDMNKKIEKKKTELKYNEQKISQLIDFQEANDTLEAKILEAREGYFPIMTSDEVDRYFTDLALKHNLYAYSLDIHMPSEYCNLKPYQYSQKALKPVVEEEEFEPVQEETDVDSENADSEEEDADSEMLVEEFPEQEVVNGIYGVNVEMILTGEPADISKLVSELSHNDSRMRVRSYKYSQKRRVEVEEGQYDVVEELSLNIAVEIYMCEE